MKICIFVPICNKLFSALHIHELKTVSVTNFSLSWISFNLFDQIVYKGEFIQEKKDFLGERERGKGLYSVGEAHIWNLIVFY